MLLAMYLAGSLAVAIAWVLTYREQLWVGLRRLGREPRTPFEEMACRLLIYPVLMLMLLPVLSWAGFLMWAIARLPAPGRRVDWDK